MHGERRDTLTDFEPDNPWAHGIDDARDLVPATKGIFGANTYLPVSMMRSVAPTPPARTRTRNSPGPGSVTGKSTGCSTSGPPGLVIIIAR